MKSFKYKLLVLFLIIGNYAFAQNKALHKGQLLSSDTIIAELVYPNKKNPTFKIYVYGNNMASITNNKIKSAKITFYFTADKTAMLSPALMGKDTYFETNAGDLEGFQHGIIQLEIDNIQHKFTFKNNKYKPEPTHHNNSGGDGHSGHTH